MKAIPKPRKKPTQARSQHMVEVILEATARVLAEQGYAGANTNAIAARAGISIGSVYQYFPNKDALVAALHEHHALQMYHVIDSILGAAQPRSLQEHIEAIVHALLAAHQLAPALHKVLERELPFFDAPKSDSPADASFFLRIHALLEEHQHIIAHTNLDLATWTILNIMESLIHAAVIDPPPHLHMPDMEGAIVDTLMGYLMHTTSRQ